MDRRPKMEATANCVPRPATLAVPLGTDLLLPNGEGVGMLPAQTLSAWVAG